MAHGETEHGAATPAAEGEPRLLAFPGAKSPELLAHSLNQVAQRNSSPSLPLTVGESAVERWLIPPSLSERPSRPVLFSPPEPAEHAAGSGLLSVQQVDGQSTVTSVYATSPLKILVPRSRGPSVWAYLSSFGGGMVAGDRTQLKVQLGAHTRCLLSTQASTKIYRNSTARPCHHQMSAEVGEGSLLILAPDPVQAFAGSRYSQRQEFHLHPRAGLVLVDWFCSGRASRGERWAFELLESRNEVFLNQERIFLDALRLEALDGALDGRHRMGRFNCLAMVTVIGTELAPHGARIQEEIAALPVRRQESLLLSGSQIKSGFVFRFAGEQIEVVAREIQRRLAFVSTFLQDDPWIRKW